MPFENYVMGYKLPVLTQRYHDYRAGLLDPWEIVVFYQDVIEAEKIPLAHMAHAIHMVERRLCTLPDQLPRH